MKVFVKISGSTCHSLTWLKSKGISVRGYSTFRRDHYLTITASSFKIENYPPFDLGVLLTAPSQELWDLHSPSLSSSRFTLQFDMVAERSPDFGPGSFATSFFCPIKSVTTTTVTTRRLITSSSGEAKETPHWSSKLQEESDIKMFTNDPELNPRLLSPTSFDGVKPSHVRRSEELLTYLPVTEYQEFVPILQAVTGHKDVITKKLFVERVLSEHQMSHLTSRGSWTPRISAIGSSSMMQSTELVC